MLSQIIYISERNSSCSESEIEKIIESCKKNNSKLDITGVLLFNEKRFLQLVEGEHKTITNLYDKIKKDTRHQNCVLISFGPIKDRSFPSWQMGLKKIDNTLDFKTDVSDTDKKFFNSIFSGKEDKEGLKSLALIKKLFN